MTACNAPDFLTGTPCGESSRSNPDVRDGPKYSVVVLIDFEDDGSVRSSVFTGTDAQFRADQHRARRHAERLDAVRLQAAGAKPAIGMQDRVERRLARAA